jgi:hypothetical protein
MHKYVRHPADIPINFRLGALGADHREYARNIGQGGLCFLSPVHINPGTAIHIEIAVAEPTFRAEGMVVWCRRNEEERAFEVGVGFEGLQTAYSIRMVEQVCHIEHYRQEVFRTEGRTLTSEEAALEWIEQFSARFPW